MSRYAADEGRLVYVGNLPNDIRERELNDLFHKYGRIRHIDITALRNPPPFAFIEFDDRKDAQDAVLGGDRYVVAGNRISVEIAKFRRDHEERAPDCRVRSRPRSLPGGENMFVQVEKLLNKEDSDCDDYMDDDMVFYDDDGNEFIKTKQPKPKPAPRDPNAPKKPRPKPKPKPIKQFDEFGGEEKPPQELISLKPIADYADLDEIKKLIGPESEEGDSDLEYNGMNDDYEEDDGGKKRKQRGVSHGKTSASQMLPAPAKKPKTLGSIIVSSIKQMEQEGKEHYKKTKMISFWGVFYYQINKAYMRDYNVYVPLEQERCLYDAEKKARANEYTTVDQFLDDIKQMIDNAVTYHSSGYHAEPFYVSFAPQLLPYVEKLLADRKTEIDDVL